MAHPSALHERRRPLNAAELAGVPWLSHLKAEEFDRAAPELRISLAEPGELVCRRGRPVTYWFGVVDGLLKMSTETAEGQTITYSGLAPGGWFGEGTLMRLGVWRYQAQAIRTCELALVPRETFLWLLERNIAFNHYLLQQLNDRLELMTLQALDDQQSGAESIVARTLRHLFHPLAGANGGALKVTQSEIGQLCHLSRQRVNQAFQRLEADGVLHLRYGGVEILDTDKLRAWEFHSLNAKTSGKSQLKLRPAALSRSNGVADYSRASDTTGESTSASSAEPPGCGTRG